jgi:hypothetical protein
VARLLPYFAGRGQRGAFAPIFGFKESKSAWGFAEPFRVIHPHTALVPTLDAEGQHCSFVGIVIGRNRSTERPLGES